MISEDKSAVTPFPSASCISMKSEDKSAVTMLTLLFSKLHLCVCLALQTGRHAAMTKPNQELTLKLTAYPMCKSSSHPCQKRCNSCPETLLPDTFVPSNAALQCCNALS